MAREDGLFKDLFFAIGVATVALGATYLITKAVKKRLNGENESIFGEGCICADCNEDNDDTCEHDICE